MFRPTTSNVSALSSFVANSHQAMPTVPLPPLKFRTVGFPQYGFKRVCRWRPSPGSQAYTPHTGSSDRKRNSLAFFQGTCSASEHTLAQWPLAPPRVLLSHRIFAYYGHIRASVRLRAV